MKKIPLKYLKNEIYFEFLQKNKIIKNFFINFIYQLLLFFTKFFEVLLEIYLLKKNVYLKNFFIIVKLNLHEFASNLNEMVANLLLIQLSYQRQYVVNWQSKVEFRDYYYLFNFHFHLCRSIYFHWNH